MQLANIINGNLKTPQGVAISGSQLILADTGNHQIALVDLTASPPNIVSRNGFMGTNANAEGFLFPRSLCLLASTTLIVADTQNNHIDAYSMVGNNWTYQRTVAAFPGISSLGRIIDILQDGPNAVLILDELQKQILRTDPANGNSAVLMGNASWKRPIAIKTGGGYLWVADAEGHCIFRYDSLGGETVIGSYGMQEGKLSRPNGIAIDTASSSVFVAEGDNGRVSRFSFDGQFQESIYLPRGVPHELHGMELDATGQLWVADAAADVIYGIDTGSIGPRPLLIPSRIDFGLVGVGYSLPFNARLQNNGDADLSVLAINAIGNGFLSANLPSFPATITAGSFLDIEVLFEPAVAGPANGVLEIQTSSAQMPLLTHGLYGVAGFAAPTAVVMVIDRSGSMQQSSGQFTKFQRVKDAVSLMTRLFRDRGSDRIALVSFSNSARLDLSFSSPDSDFSTVMNSVQTGGGTSIGSGCVAAVTECATSDIQRKAIIVLTDGMQNVSPMIQDTLVQDAVQNSGASFFSVGLGFPENIDVEILSGLASNNSGYFQLTDERFYLLPKFFVQIFSDTVGQQLVLDPPLLIPPSGQEVVPFILSSKDRAFTIVITWDAEKWQCATTLESPAGNLLSPLQYEVIDDATFRILKVPQSRPGTWKLHLSGAASSKPVQAVVSILAESELRIAWNIEHTTLGSRGSLPSVPQLKAAKAEMFPPIAKSPAQRTVKVNETIRICPFLQENFPVTGISGLVQVEPPKWSLDFLRSRNPQSSSEDKQAVKRPGVFISVFDSLFKILLAIVFAILASGSFVIGYPVIAFVTLFILALIMVFFYLRYRQQTSVRSFRWNVQDGRIVAEIPTYGKDGLYSITARLTGTLADGSTFQREHAFTILAQP